MTTQNIEQLQNSLEGQRIAQLGYVQEEDYYVLELENGSEFCFRFMADIIKDSK